MANIEHGFQRAIETMVGGIIASLVIRALLDSLNIGNFAILISILIYTISIFSIIALSGKMKYWGFMYTIGWFFGLIIMMYALSSMISPAEIVLYIIITIIALIIKMSNKL